jgi:peptidyl-prolyl cis-trans isomerase B (cyclophilin B)
MYRSFTVVVVVAVAALAGCGGDDEESESRAQQAETAPAEQEAGCKEVPQPEPRDGGGQKKPKPLDPAKTYEVVLQTSCGDFTIRLDQKTSPQAAASFAALSRNGFFDDTIFHRIVPDFVIQGGDPTVSGSGGPGYSTRDEVPSDAAYEPGVVAMAKAGNEPPGTGGSQFFVVTGSSTGLTPDYALLGKVSEGMDVAKKIGSIQADPNTGQPAATVIIKSVTVEES